MNKETASEKLLHKPAGTFLLRENEDGDLRLTIRSNLRDGRSNKAKSPYRASFKKCVFILFKSLQIYRPPPEL